MKFQDELKKIGACSDAVEWVGDKNLVEAWEQCECGEWMLWLSGKFPQLERETVLSACDIAQDAVDRYWTNKEDLRPQQAIDAAKSFDSVCDAALSAWGATDATDAADACSAARAAACAAAWAVRGATWAADAAADAADAARFADADRSVEADAVAQKEHAEIVRKHISVEMVVKAWNER